MTALRDIALVARFEVLRAVRTWQALALVLVFLIANVGGAAIFLESLLVMENSVAEQFSLPTVSRPGAMTTRMIESGRVQDMLSFFAGDGEGIDHLVERPLIGVFQQWFGMLFMPFLAATTAAETIAVDVQNRAIRFEALRVARLELVLGRYVGQLVLVLGAATLSVFAVLCFAWFRMAPQPLLPLIAGMMSGGGAAVLFCIPFVGLGMMASQMVGTPGWARVIALVLTTVSWIVPVLPEIDALDSVTFVLDPFVTFFPAYWYENFYQLGTPWWTGTLMCAAVSLAFTGVGFLFFSRRDL